MLFLNLEWRVLYLKYCLLIGTSLEVMAESEKQAPNEFHGITPLQPTASLNQHIQCSDSITQSTGSSTSTSTTSISMTTTPLTSSTVCKESNSQVEALEDTVTHSMPPPGLQNISTHSNVAFCQNVPVLKESSIASGSFLFGPSDDGFSKDHNQLLCAPDGTGNTIPLPVRQSSFSDTNPLTPVRSKVCTSDYTDQGAPLTPTANLKLLLSAASPAIREREMMQQNTSRNVCRSILTDAAADVTEEFEYSRKQKSLSILCSRFVHVSVCMCLWYVCLCVCLGHELEIMAL